MALEYWPCYHSYRKKCEKLTDQELGRLVRSLMVYSETGERQELAGRESIAFDFIADDIDRARDKYDAKCEQNRENRKKQPSTDDNDRQRPSTTVNDRDQNKNKNKSKSKVKSEINAFAAATRAQNEPSHETSRFDNPELARVMSFFFDRINPTPSEIAIDELKGYTETLGADVVIHAFEIALDNKSTTWRYIRGILMDYQRDGLSSIEAVREAEADFNRRKQENQPPRGKERRVTTFMDV